MNAFRGALVIAIAQASKIIIGLVLIKMIAVSLGPAGLGKLGNFMSAMALLSLLAGGGVVNGVIKNISEYSGSLKAIIAILASVKVYSFLICLSTLLLSGIFSKEISKFIFGSDKYYWLVYLVLMSHFFMAFSNVVIGALNGYRRTDLFSKLQIYSSCISFVFFIFVYMLDGGFVEYCLCIIVSYLSYVVPSFFFYYKSIFFNRLKINRARLKYIKKFLPFSCMAIAGAISFPVVEIIVRQHLIAEVGLEAAGLWQGSIRLAGAYFGFFNLFLVYYLVPILSAEKDWKKIRKIVFQYVFYVASVFIIFIVVFYYFRFELITIALSDDFYPLGELIAYQLVGDFFRVMAYVMGVVVIAKAAAKFYILGEFLQGGGFLLFFAFAFIGGSSDAVSVFQAQLLASFIYFAIVLLVFFCVVARLGSNDG